MAFLSPDCPKIVGPTFRLERSPFVVLTNYIYVGTWVRGVYELRIQWSIDDTGGESVPMTWTHEGQTYLLQHGGPDIGFDSLDGLYTAVYERATGWLDEDDWIVTPVSSSSEA